MYSLSTLTLALKDSSAEVIAFLETFEEILDLSMAGFQKGLPRRRSVWEHEELNFCMLVEYEQANSSPRRSRLPSFSHLAV